MWQLDTTQIVVTGLESSNKQIIARLQPLAGGTVHHIFGYDDRVLKLTGVVVGLADKQAIEGFTKDAATHVLSYIGLVYGTAVYGGYSWLVNSVTFTQRNVIRQSIIPSKSCTSEVYDCTMELYEVVT